MNTPPNTTPRTKAELQAALADAISCALETDRAHAQARREIAQLTSRLAAADEQISHLDAIIDVALEEQDFLRNQLIAARRRRAARTQATLHTGAVDR